MEEIMASCHYRSYSGTDKTFCRSVAGNELPQSYGYRYDNWKEVTAVLTGVNVENVFVTNSLVIVNGDIHSLI
jgi:hypothetical protein